MINWESLSRYKILNKEYYYSKIQENKNITRCKKFDNDNKNEIFSQNTKPGFEMIFYNMVKEIKIPYDYACGELENKES